jgi:hypothetical protein
MAHHRPLALFWLTLAGLGMALLTGISSPRRLAWLPHGFERPILALEFVESAEAFTRIVGQRALEPSGRPAAPLYRRGTYVDLAFIAAYGLLWVGIPLSCVPKRERRLVRHAVVAAVVVAVVADYVEDAGILSGLGGNPNADLIRVSALIKWTALGLAYHGMTWCFWPDHHVNDGWQLWNAAIGILYSYSGVLCLLGVFVSHPLIERVALPIGVALLMQLFSFWHAHRRSRRRAAGVAATAVAS